MTEDKETTKYTSVKEEYYSLIAEIVKDMQSAKEKDWGWLDRDLKPVLRILAEKLTQLYTACSSNKLLLEYISEQHLTTLLLEVTAVRHHVVPMDIACLQLLELLVHTEYGYQSIKARQDLIVRWKNHTNESFKDAALPLVIAFEAFPINPDTFNITAHIIQSTLQKRDQFSFPALERYGLGRFDGCGIILVDDDFRITEICHPTILRRRLRSIPILYDCSPQATLALFYKGCPGCMALNLFCAGELLGAYDLLTDVLKELLRKKNCYLSSFEVMNYCKLTRTAYRRKGDPYPYAGTCMDFDTQSRCVKEMIQLGGKWM
jgi:hypothetical protein